MVYVSSILTTQLTIKLITMFKIDNKKYNLVTYPDGKVTNSIDLNKVEILNELYTQFPFNKETDSKEKYKETIQDYLYETITYNLL